ncbi:XkdX family protein [Cytobacillus firmus]|nr:XkdX family protein [Cytobacillus firmus]MED1908538.1 XkdX family protein [Cytobacillus firmus]
MWYSTIKRYYDNGHHSYTDESLKNFVKANMISADQYTEITGVPYEA